VLNIIYYILAIRVKHFFQHPHNLLSGNVNNLNVLTNNSLITIINDMIINNTIGIINNGIIIGVNTNTDNAARESNIVSNSLFIARSFPESIEAFITSFCTLPCLKASLLFFNISFCSWYDFLCFIIFT